MLAHAVERQHVVNLGASHRGLEGPELVVAVSQGTHGLRREGINRASGAERNLVLDQPFELVGPAAFRTKASGGKHDSFPCWGFSADDVVGKEELLGFCGFLLGHLPFDVPDPELGGGIDDGVAAVRV